MIIELIDAEPYDENLILATVEVTDAGETRKLAYILPRDTMEWRVAEFDMDPVADAELLLDMVMYEPFSAIPAGAGLYDAPTHKAAKDAKLASVKGVKDKSDLEKAKRPSTPAPLRQEGQPAREKLRALLVLDLEVVDVKRQHVAKTREAVERPAVQEAPMSRLDKIKLQLEGGTDARNDVHYSTRSPSARPGPNHG